MRIVEAHDILNVGSFRGSTEWVQACEDVEKAVRAVDWPHGSGTFTIAPVKHGNGVVPIKKPCIDYLKLRGWTIEDFPRIKRGLLKTGRTGDLDALFESLKGYIGFEWETGNVSSSHRAINKLLYTLQVGGIKGGILVVPSNKLAPYLTDRIGNIGELRPYFQLWSSVPIPMGCLRVVVVEHDAESMDVALIKKGTDGWAKGTNQGST